MFIPYKVILMITLCPCSLVIVSPDFSRLLLAGLTDDNNFFPIPVCKEGKEGQSLAENSDIFFDKFGSYLFALNKHAVLYLLNSQRATYYYSAQWQCTSTSKWPGWEAIKGEAVTYTQPTRVPTIPTFGNLPELYFTVRFLTVNSCT